MENLDKATLAALEHAGIEFVGGVRIPAGQQTVSLNLGDLPNFVADKELWFAKKHGVTKEDYLGWIESDGLPRCGATTAQGTRCRNAVSGGSQRALLDWLNEDSGFCAVHGGTTNAEAKKTRWGRPK